MADFTDLIANIEAYVKENGNNDITGDGLQDILVGMVGAIGEALNDAVSDLESADTTLTNAIGDEELARQGADNTLGGRITAEEEARAGADTGLQNQINGINGKIPDEASGTNKLADKAFVQGLVDTLTASIAAINDKIPSEASSSNKLADKAFVQALTTALQNALNTLNGKVPTAATSENQLADKAFVTSLTTALQNAINAINTNIGNGFVYAGVATPAGTPVSGKVAYLTAQAGTYTNYGGLVVPAGISVIKYDGTNWSQEQVISMETIYRNPLMGMYDCDNSGSTAAKTVTAVGYILPTNGGAMKVRMANHTTVDNVTLNINGTGAKDLYYKGKAAGINNTWGDGAVLNVIYDSTNDRYLAYNANAGTGDGVFDVSEYTGDDYARLEDAIADIPVSEQHGGMMIRFVQSSDNKYVQCRLMADEWSTTESDWQGVDNKPKPGSHNTVESGGVYASILPLAQKYNFTLGAYFNLSSVNVGDTISLDMSLLVTDNVNYGYVHTEIEEKDVIYIKTKNNTSSAKAYAITDADGKVLSINSSDISETVTVPATSKWLIVNTGNYAADSYLYIIKRSVIDSLEKAVKANNNFLLQGDFRNGNATNIYKGYYVTTKMVPLNGANKVVIYTNRPNKAGCTYRYGYCISESVLDIDSLEIQDNLVGPAARRAISSADSNKIPLVNITNESYKCINFTIGEYDDSNESFKPLSIEDFSFYGYYIKILADHQIEEIINNSILPISERIKNKVENESDLLTVEGIISLLKHTNASIKGELTSKYYNLSSAETGQSYTPTTANGPGYTGTMIDIVEGDVFIINTTDNTSSAKAYAILDNNSVVLDVKENAVNKMVVAPANASKLIVNTKNTAQNFLVKVGALAEYAVPTEYISPETLNKSLTSKSLMKMLASGNKSYLNVTKNRYVDMTSATIGNTYSLTTQYAQNYTYEELDVNEGEVFNGYCKGTTSSAKAYVILDQNSKVLDVQSYWDGTYITMPVGAKKFYVNSITNQSGYYLYKIVGKFEDISAFNAMLPYEIKLDNKNRYFNLSSISVGTIVAPKTLSAPGYSFLYCRVFKGERYTIVTNGNTTAAKSYALMDLHYEVLEFAQSAGGYDISVMQDGWLVVNTTYDNYSIIQYNWQIRLQKGFFDNIYSSVYDFARFNNDFKFDYAQIDQLYAGSIRLGYERSLPRKGSAINTDIELSYSITDESTEDDITKRCVPYLYWNQKKIGTIVLFDETTGKPYIYDRSGNKVILAIENV